MSTAAKRWWQAAPRLVAAGLLLVPAGAASRSVQLLMLASLGVAVGCGGHALASRWLPRVRATDRALATAVLGLAVSLVIGVALGHAGQLTGAAFRAVLALLVVATIFTKPGSGREDERRETPPSSPAAPPSARGPRRLLPRAGAAVVVAALAASGAGLLQRVHHHRHAAPGRFSFDDTSYHLTTVATWQAHRDLSMPRFSYGDPRTAFYPFGSELLAWELTTPFAGGDFAARWVELPFALLSLLALAVVARRLGAGRVGCWLAPLLYLTVTEAFPNGALTAGNDHAVAFASLAAVHAALLVRGCPGAGTGAYAGAALGLLVGTKLVGLLFAPLLGLTLLLGLATSRAAAAHRGRRRLATIAACCAAVLAVGGYSYLRNAASAGNPFFPVRLEIGPFSLPGWGPALGTVRDTSPESAIDPLRFPWARRDALGPLFRWTMLPASLLAPALALLLGRSRRRFLVAFCFALPLVVYLLFVFLIDDHRGARYVFAGIAIAAIATAWLVGKLPRNATGVASAILAAIAAGPWVIPQPGLLAAGLLVALVWWIVARRRPERGLARRRPVAAFTLLAAALLAPAGARTLAKYERHRLDDDKPAAALATLTGSRPTRIAYLGWNQPYLLCGERLQSSLFMVPGGRKLEAMLYRWGSDPTDPYLDPASRRRWLRNLAALDIEYVVWVAQGAKAGPERWWMERSGFERRWGDGRTEIWQVPRGGEDEVSPPGRRRPRAAQGARSGA